MTPLLAIDGDSFAHRAFHAPRVGLARRRKAGNAHRAHLDALRLWQAERPRAVIVGWDSLGVPTYRNELLEGYQAGREFDPDILEQLEMLPALLETGIVCGKKAGYEADDVLAAAVAASVRTAAQRSSRPPIATRISSQRTT